MRILILFFTVISLSLSSQIEYDKYFTTETLRIDFYRNSGENNNQFDSLVFKKELYWSGNPNKTIEPFDYGEYRVEVKEIETNKLLFTYSYSSLYHEFIFTEESKLRSKRFEETVRTPFPKVAVDISFYFRNQNTGRWIREHSIIFNPQFENVERVKLVNTPIISKIHSGGDYRKSLDVVFLADGYQEDEKQKFIDDSERISKYLLNCQPFNNRNQDINIWAVFMPSEDSGINDPLSKIEKNTFLELNFSTFESDRYLMTESIFKTRDLASSVPYDQIVIIANTKKYGGGGIFNFYATCPSDNYLTNYLLIHEFGHSFGGLADEYYTSDVSVVDFYNLKIEPWEPNITSLINFDLKWKEMVSSETPIPTPARKKYSNEVGVFEGGGYVEFGIYRPYIDCSMKSAKYDNFCPVCQASLVKVLNYYVDN